MYKNIPEELFHQANDFICLMNENVELYKILRKKISITPCLEADKFIAYWTLADYINFPHALITLYESMDEIDNNFGVVNSENVEKYMQYRMKSYYLLLKENNLIKE